MSSRGRYVWWGWIVPVAVGLVLFAGAVLAFGLAVRWILRQPW